MIYVLLTLNQLIYVIERFVEESYDSHSRISRKGFGTRSADTKDSLTVSMNKLKTSVSLENKNIDLRTSKKSVGLINHSFTLFIP